MSTCGAKRQLGNPSPKWAFLEPYQIDYDDAGVYLKRFRVFATPLTSLHVHRLYGPDPDDDPHDHPYPFGSFLVWGHYIEEYGSEGRVRTVRWFNFKRAGTPHRIIALSRRPVWTIVFCGPRFRGWGFHTPSGWIPWKQYRKKSA